MSSDADLARVASLYVQAMTVGQSPHKVITAAGYPKATATRRIAECRRRGLLPAAAHGHVNVRALRVANALGVSYQALVDAVREHAGGDLRVPLED